MTVLLFLKSAGVSVSKNGGRKRGSFGSGGQLSATWAAVGSFRKGFFVSNVHDGPLARPEL